MKKLLILICILSFINIGCSIYGKDNPDKSLPSNSYDIVDIGNGWSTFRWEEIKFIYHNSCSPGTSELECITRIE